MLAITHHPGHPVLYTACLYSTTIATGYTYIASYMCT